MPNNYSSAEIVKVLESIGFHFVSQKGSHGKFKDGCSHIVIVPMSKKEIPEGTLRSILRQADISLIDFKKHLQNL
ncbi:type II toxin-antitoxin system HicA family toxin [Gracilinema caldarium]|uniref:YcfA family protein n=1 Tax=Gracilinema caldarium (strain ATCC 51460 / DSM 7334 / H1) TaxID=744872 RepID=F8F460_GRAC1|nr:YcfA family protein [Gracilinema caldarium DSM 7334]